jgi:aspartate/methionine/tyrosine aminotransferase
MRPEPASRPPSLFDEPRAVARAAIRSLTASRIREIANAGMHDPDVLAFWFGEPDQVTPAFIRDAATASLDALTGGTRAVMINSPNNPTGWTIDRASQQAIFDHCARLGIWIVADDVYERLYFEDGAACAPSFLDLATADARVVSTNSFSKAWLMTGWRLGWIVAPPALMPDLGKLIEYNTSCSPVFVQRAGVVALRDGESTVAATRERLRRARDRLIGALREVPGVDTAPPAGAMYAFFRVAAARDSMQFCRRLVHEARLGLAPGSAFGPEGEGFVRWCFAASDERLDEGVVRLGRYLATARPRR